MAYKVWYDGTPAYLSNLISHPSLFTPLAPWIGQSSEPLYC